MANVPNVAGVPPLASFAEDVVGLLVADAIGLLLGSSTPQWGIFLDGLPVIAAENTISFEYKQDFPVSDYPVEDGGFQSYDKVQLPGDIRMRFSCGGSVEDRQNFLASIDAVMNTTDLYDVVTPEAVYLSYNFVHRDFRRTAQNGVGLIVVDIWLTEIRVTSTATFTNTQQPGNAGQQNIGNQQPQTPDATFDQRFSTSAVQ